MHFLKYNLIGILNTLISLLVVWILYQIFSLNLVVSNFLGFVAGAINSYLCNRIWNFKSQNKKRTEVIRFVIVFLIAYLVNLLVLKLCDNLLSDYFMKTLPTSILTWIKPGYIANLFANITYVSVSYFLFRFWVFSPKNFKDN